MEKIITKHIRAGAVKAFGIIGLVIGMACGAQAQEYQSILATGGVIPIGLSNRVEIVALKGSVASFQLNTKLTGAGTSGIAVIVEGSNDNSTWSTTPIQFWRAANGNTAVSHLTNFTLPYPFARVTVHNTNSLAVTNSTISVVVNQVFR